MLNVPTLLIGRQVMDVILFRLFERELFCFLLNTATISVKGNYYFYSKKSRYYIKYPFGVKGYFMLILRDSFWKG